MEEWVGRGGHPGREKSGGSGQRETLGLGRRELRKAETPIQVSRAVFTGFLRICFPTFLEQRGL